MIVSKMLITIAEMYRPVISRNIIAMIDNSMYIDLFPDPSFSVITGSGALGLFCSAICSGVSGFDAITSNRPMIGDSRNETKNAVL